MRSYLQRVGRLLGGLQVSEAPSDEVTAERLAIDGVTAEGRANSPLQSSEFTLREHTHDKVFFVVGPARSGTSATIRALSHGKNVTCFEQKLPRFIKFIRDYERGMFHDVESLVLQHRWEDMRKVLLGGKIYGEKDQQIYPWIAHYWRLFGGRYVNVVKDGRDAVRSLMDFYENVNGLLYLEAGDVVELAEDVAGAQQTALSNAGAREAEANRPRPSLCNAEFDEWRDIPRIGMVAWHWSHIIRTGARELRKIPTGRQMRVNFTGGPSVLRFEELYDFLGIEGFDDFTLSEFLRTRPNSIKSKLKAEKDPFPAWPEWSADQSASFDRYAATAMVENGFYPIEKFPFRTRASEFMAAPLQAGQHGQTEDVIHAIIRALRAWFIPTDNTAPAIVLLPTQEQAAIAIDEFGANNLSVKFWSGERFGLIPNEPKSTVVAVGLLEISPDIPLLLNRLSDLTQARLVIANIFAPFSWALDTDYRASTSEALPINSVSLSQTMSLLENALGFERVKVKCVETPWVLNPRTQMIIAER